MSIEELMKPRYKVIADYPKSLYHVGDIVNAGGTGEDCIYCDREGPRMRDYPHLFQPLPWWESRDKSDLPMYLKDQDRIWKLTGWGIDMMGEPYPINLVDKEGETERFCDIAWHFRKDKMLPTTPDDYTAYITQTQQP